MQSKEVLKEALKEFNGTLICVSHDRDFLDGLVEKVYEFGGGKVKEHIGGIYDFLRKKKMASLQELERKQPNKNNTQPIGVAAPTASKLSYEQQKAEAAAKRKKEKQIAETEAEIGRLEDEQKQMEALLQDPQQQTQENFRQYEHIKHLIQQKLYEWEILSDS
jgi:ATP-binding cassette subfamily F protein 3